MWLRKCFLIEERRRLVGILFVVKQTHVIVKSMFIYKI